MSSATISCYSINVIIIYNINETHIKQTDRETIKMIYDYLILLVWSNKVEQEFLQKFISKST